MRLRSESFLHGIGLVLISALLLAAPIFTRGTLTTTHIWILEALLLLLFVFGIGHWVTGMWLGAFTNDRNRMSLSQSQLIVWTVLVLSAFLTGSLENLADGDQDALNITVPESLWLLMGISTFSMIGSPMLASRRKSQKSDQKEEAGAFNKLADEGRDVSRLTNSGRLLANQVLGDARWSDLFEAEELSHAGRIDMSKVQMTLFTIIVAAVYASAISVALGTASGFHEFPELSESMTFLVGISHAGYLINKTVPERERL